MSIMCVCVCGWWGGAIKRRLAQGRKEKDRGDERERWERRREAGYEHMLPLCAKPHWLRQPTHTLHCCHSSTNAVALLSQTKLER